MAEHSSAQGQAALAPDAACHVAPLPPPEACHTHCGTGTLPPLKSRCLFGCRRRSRRSRRRAAASGTRCGGGRRGRLRAARRACNTSAVHQQRRGKGRPSVSPRHAPHAPPHIHAQLPPLQHLHLSAACPHQPRRAVNGGLRRRHRGGPPVCARQGGGLRLVRRCAPAAASAAAAASSACVRPASSPIAGYAAYCMCSLQASVNVPHLCSPKHASRVVPRRDPPPLPQAAAAALQVHPMLTRRRGTGSGDLPATTPATPLLPGTPLACTPASPAAQTTASCMSRC